MKKTFYSLMLAFVCLLASFPVYPQAPDGSFCNGKVTGALSSSEGVYTIFMTSHNETSFGARPSVINYYQPDNSFLTSPSIISFTHDLEVQLSEENTLYGIATRYEGPVAVESSIFISPWFESYNMRYLKTCNVATQGTYSVQAMHGNYLYGLRSGGGQYGFGVYFRIKKDGTNYTELYHFKGAYEKPEKLLLQYLFNGDGTPDKKYPVEFWGISFAGGSHGKGALLEIELDGSAVNTMIDFTGQGGPRNEWDDTDGEGPIAIVRDVDSDVYVITQSGGLYNSGAIFMVGQDGVTRIQDFPVATGRPFGTPVVDRNTHKLFGICGSGNVSQNGFLYSMNLGSPGFDTHFVDFSASPEVRSPISLVIGPDGLIYGNARRGATMTSNGIFFSVEQNGTNLHAIEEFSNCLISVAQPANNATNVSVTPLLNVSNGNHTGFFYQLSETPNFTTGVLEFEGEDYEPIVQSSLLKYATTYYARARPDMDFFGPVTQFTTRTAPAGSYVSNPANSATDISITPLVKVTTVAGATNYTVEVSKFPDFSSEVISVNTASTEVRLPRLSYLTTYYSRVKTNLSASYGQLRQFTTHGPEKFSHVTYPANGASFQHNAVPDLLVNVVYGATLYTIELNNKPDFTGASMVQTSNHPNDREFDFDGFVPGTTYYSRVKTDLPSDWGPTRSFTIQPYSGPTIVINPIDHATGISTRPAIDILKVSNATLYTLQIYETANFTGTGINYNSGTNNISSGAIILNYSKQYYARVKTNLYPYSFPISFTTRSPVDDSYITSPVQGGFRVPIHDLPVTCNMVWGATQYTVELNTNQNFTGTSFVQTGATRDFVFPVLPLSTTLYARVKTNLSPQWGKTVSFFTAVAIATTVSDPEDGATGVSSRPLITVRGINGATHYEVHFFETPDFSGQGFAIFTDEPNVPQQHNLALGYSKKYYVRVRTNLSQTWGPVTSFTTRSIVEDAFVVTPADEAIDVSANNLTVTSNHVWNSTTYTIELNTRPDFFGTSFVQTSTTDYQRSLTFNGLAAGTTYYTRVRTEDTNGEFGYEWGPITSFTTTLPSSIVTNPAHNKTDVPPRTSVSVRPYPGASTYTLDLSTSEEFSTGVTTYQSSTTTIAINPLKYSTTYFARVKTNVSGYGTVTTFATHHAEKFSYVTSPANGAVNVAFNSLNVLANEVVGATIYTIELNTNPDFTGTWIVGTSSVPNQRSITFTGLSPSTTYYSRTRTNLPSNWGPVRSFTTAAASSPPPEEIENTSSSLVKAYPNPFERHFTAEVAAQQDEYISVVLFDLTGRELYRKETSADFKEELGEGLPQGVYLLKVMKGNTLVVRRMIKN